LERAASNYRDGEFVGWEDVAKYVTPELAYIVSFDRLKAKIGGSAEFTPIALRATSVFRREDNAWKLVHRHADPITAPRPAESIIQK
jgi:ketosteroid isomerase-like protein